MVDLKNSVDFYWDPVCPWCWITARWMIDVGQQKNIRLNWKFFSLKLINKGREIPPDFSLLHDIGLKALRVAAAVRQDFGNDGVGEFYSSLGTCYHHDKGDIDDPAAIGSILRDCGFPSELAAAAGDEIRDREIQADMDCAILKAGTDVGVPLIVLDGGNGAGFFGPVISPAPAGEDALKLWDAIVAAVAIPGFFELKRTRNIRPIFGNRPEIRTHRSSDENPA